VNRTIFVLLLPALLACAVKNTVASDNQTPEEKLSTELSARCASICGWATQCTPPPCDCTGASCGCAQKVDPSTCPSDCENSLSAYSGKGDVCANAGLGILDCLSGASCATLYQTNTLCQPSDATRSACTSDSSATSPDSSIGGGPGSTSTGSGGTGPTAAAVTCQVGTGEGVAGSANTGGGSFISCEQSFAGCSDGHSYDAVCVVDDQNAAACSCFIDGTLQTSFAPSAACPDVAEIDAHCGWLVTP
jgi:hypothetical protein